jgi:hypothetical protein
MAYRLNYSDYSTSEGPPDPAEWVGPPGPAGPVGPTGPQGIPGEIDDVLATGSTTPRPIEDWTADVANVLAFGADPTGIADSSAAINAAAAQIAPNGRNKAVYLPAGWYHVRNQINLTAGQCMYGDSRGSSIITVTDDFNPAATAVIVVTPGSLDPGPVIRDLGIIFVQPSDVTNRAAFKTLADGGTSGPGGSGVRYPWAIAAGGPSFRTKIERVRIGGAWDGITSNGFNAVFWLDDVEVGALDCGVSLGEGASGILDFCHIDNFHFWNFDFTSAQHQTVFGDGQTIALRLGNVNGLNASGINCLIGRVVFTADAAAGWFYITNLGLDYYQSTLEIAAANFLQITNVYSTSTAAAVRPSIDITATTAATRIIIANAFLQSATALPQIGVTGGDVTVIGCYMQQDAITASAVAVSGGTLRMNDTTISPGAGAWSAPLVSQTATGVLQIDNLDVGSPGSSGTAVRINVDNPGNIVGKVALGSGWSNSIVAGSNGIYGPFASIASVPVAASSAPVMDGAVAVGTGTTWARDDHRHPSDTSRLSLAGGNLTGFLVAEVGATLGLPAGPAISCYLQSAAGAQRALAFYTATTQRWGVVVDAAAEGGGGAGSNFSILRFNDAGAPVDAPFGINRATGRITTILATSTSYASDAAAAAGGVGIGQLYRNGSVVQVRVT